MKSVLVIRMIVAVTTAAFLNSVSGCSSVMKTSFDETRSQPQRKISSLVLPVQIQGVGILPGTETVFNESGGFFDEKDRMINGVTEAGQTINVRLNEITYVMVRKSTLDDFKIDTMTADRFALISNRKPWRSVAGRSVQDGEVITFNKDGGTFDSQKQVITGVTVDGRQVEVGSKDVLFVQSKHFNARKTVIVSLAAGTVAGFALILLALHACQGECH